MTPERCPLEIQRKDFSLKRLIRFFVDNVLFADLLTVAIILLGVMSLFSIRREIFPNVNFDIIQINTVFPAASPEEVERLVTNTIEQELQEIDGIKKIQSFSLEGLSQIVIFLDPDRTTADKGKTDIQNVIDRIEALPEAAKEPVVFAIESKQSPIVEVSVSGDVPEIELRNTARKLEREIEALPGVARVAFNGLRKLEYKVEVDLKNLQRYRISLDEVVSALKNHNVTVPGGTLEVKGIDRGGLERIVRTSSDFESVEDVQQVVLRSNDLGKAIRIEDVAKVYQGQTRSSVLARTNGKPAILLTILQKEKTDAIDMVDAVRERLSQVVPDLDTRIQVDLINDFSDFIRRRLNIVTGNLLIGLLLVIGFLPLLIPFRFSLIIALGEPFAFLGTVLLLYWTGHSINMISMVGLIIVSGILVDDSIVVTENAVRLVQEGKSPREAAIKGTMQILPPVLASVLTTSMAFLPMMFMSGIFGKFVKEIPVAVLTALGVSLFETFFILPAHVAHWIRAKDALEVINKSPQLGRGRKSKVAAFFRWLVDLSSGFWDGSLVPLYMKWLQLSLNYRYRVMTLLAFVFMGSLVMATQGMKFILFPPEGVEIFYIRTEAPIGTSLQRHVELLKPLEKVVEGLPPQELQDYTTTVGIIQQEPNDPNTQRGSEFAQIMVILQPETQRSRIAQEIMDDLRGRISKPPGFEQVTFSRVYTGPPVGRPVSIGVRSLEFTDILEAVKVVEAELEKIPGVFDIKNSYRLGKEELRVKVRGSEAAAALLTPAQIGASVRNAFEGTVATSIRKLDEEIDVRVSLPFDGRSEDSSLLKLLIPNAAGNLIPIERVASVSSGRSLVEVRHEANKRQVLVTADVNTETTTAIEANSKVKELLPELNRKFPNVQIAFGGEDEDTEESLKSLGRAFILAMIGIFMILVLTFKSLLQPFMVLLTVPLGVISVIWAFVLHGLPLSFMGMLGIIALAGVIVNNAIVFMDFVNQGRKNGLGDRESIVEAARTRVRPIFLTSVTTVVGILPAAYGIGGLDMFVVPIAMALGWGILFGSILTAFVFPAALAILDDLTQWRRRLTRRSTSF